MRIDAAAHLYNPKTMSHISKSSFRRAVTQKDVASHAGVSTSIVSYVINNGPRSVSQATRERVLRSIEILDYRPNKHARLLTRGQSASDPAVGQIGIVMGSDHAMFNRPFYSAILAGIYAEAHRLHMHVRFLQFLDDLADPLLFNELIRPEEVSGLLLCSLDTESPHNRAMAATRVATLDKILERVDNVICLERKWGALPAVLFDREKAAYAAAAHLISLGHTQIGFLGAHDDRLIGYRNAFFDHGLRLRQAWIAAPEGSNTPQVGHQQAFQLMSKDERPSALFACSDEVAIGAITALAELGMRVPHDVAIASIDDVEFAEFYQPRLTSVHVPKEQMGAHAVRMLQDNNSTSTDPVSIVVPTELIVRESCGAMLWERDLK